jgi:hypothetical protein
MNLLLLVEYQIGYKEKMMRKACFIKHIMCGNGMDKQHYISTAFYPLLTLVTFPSPSHTVRNRSSMTLFPRCVQDNTEVARRKLSEVYFWGLHGADDEANKGSA